ncbi:MAG: type II toxin-antitoxin system HicB family antitoxin [Alphaproteobacteria bacterium]
MVVRWFPAVIEKSKDGYGVWFPDIDGCVSAGDTVEEAVANGAEALDFWFEDAGTVPLASSFTAAAARAGRRDVVMFVPAHVPDRLERVNISLTDATLALADEIAAERGTTRSGLVQQLIHEARAARAKTSSGKRRPGFAQEKAGYKAGTIRGRGKPRR